MKYSHIITGLGLIVRAQEFHKNAATRYATLFNESFSGKPGNPELLYTPLQVLYQQLAQRHLCQFFWFEQAEQRYRDLVDVAVLDPEPGEKSTGDATDWLKAGI